MEKNLYGVIHWIREILSAMSASCSCWFEYVTLFSLSMGSHLNNYQIFRLDVFLIFQKNLNMVLYNLVPEMIMAAVANFLSPSQSFLLQPHVIKISICMNVGGRPSSLFLLLVSVCQLSWVLLTQFPPLPKSSHHLSSCLSSPICNGQSKFQRFGLLHQGTLLTVNGSKLALFLI